MMRVAAQIAPLYPDLNLDLLVAGFSSRFGKLENHLPDWLQLPFDERGVLGTSGSGSSWSIHLAQTEVDERAVEWQLTADGRCRLHLPISSPHHGGRNSAHPLSRLGSAGIVIDNLDTRLERFLPVINRKTAARIFQRVRPLEPNQTLSKFSDIVDSVWPRQIFLVNLK
jgi:hypothetical protein